MNKQELTGEKLRAAAILVMVALLIFGLVGCGIQPVASYTHISDPTIANDSFDFVCAGGEKDIMAGFTLNGSGCISSSPNRHKHFVKVEVEWRPLKQ